MFSPGGMQSRAPPSTSFPGCQFGPATNETASDSGDQSIRALLINSDEAECNENISTYFKHVVETTAGPDCGDRRNYHQLSVFALRLLTLNLFIRNYSLCLGKILSLLTVLTELDEPTNTEVTCIKEFACVCLLLLLKMKNESHESPAKEDPLLAVDIDSLFTVLRKLNMITILSRLITSHIQGLEESDSSSSYILMKFACDIVFEYLFYWELLSDDEFFAFTVESSIIPVLIRHLLSHNNFSESEEDAEQLEESSLFAYEELKLLLIINEQYLMKSYYTDTIINQVFNGLLLHGDSRSDTELRITNFINLLVYHINREESSIVKILILKFLYLVFTTSYTTKLVYLNDLKILVDIFIRELNNLDYCDDIGHENRVLIITYLKVLNPLLKFSQINEEGYKNDELIELMRNLISNATAGSVVDDLPRNQQVQSIAKLATQCLAIPWLKPKRTGTKLVRSESTSSLSLLVDDLSLEADETPFVRIASVRTSTHGDYHKNTTSHNSTPATHAQFIENNGNVFLSTANNTLASEEDLDYSKTLNLLDLPQEILSKQEKCTRTTSQPSDLRLMVSRNSSSASIASESLVNMKARKKKAPPPPGHATGTPPPPPPPPRRRR